MKKFVITLLAVTSLLVGAAMSSCSQSKNGKEGSEAGEAVDNSSPEMLAVQIEKDGRWSFYGKDGKVYCKDSIKCQPSDVWNGYYTIAAEYFKGVDFNYPYTVYKFGEKPEPVKGCTDLKAAGFMNCGLIPVTKKGERISLVDGDGNVKFRLDPVDGKEVLWCAPGFYEGLLAFCDSDNKRGYVNTEGKVVIKPRFDGASPFCEGVAIVLEHTPEGVVFKTIDKTGKVVFTFSDGFLPQSNVFSDGCIIAGKDVNRYTESRYIIVDKTGKTVFTFPDRVTQPGCYDGKYATFNGGYSYTLCYLKSKKPDMEVDYVLDYIGHDKFLKWNPGDGSIIDSNGKELLRLDKFSRYGYFEGFGIAGVNTEGGLDYVTFLTDDGKPRPGATFYRVGGMGVLNINTDYPAALNAPNTLPETD